MKLPNDKTEVLVVILNMKTKNMLQELAKKNKYGSNSSEVVRNLIESAHSKRF